VQRHAVAPDGCPALHDDERATRDVGQRGKRLGGSDGRGDGDGVDPTFRMSLILYSIFRILGRTT
jgi:hypothetical protein